MSRTPKADFGSINTFRLIGILPGPALLTASFFHKNITEYLLTGVEPKYVLFFILGSLVLWGVSFAIALWLSANIELFLAYRFLEIQNVLGQAPKNTSVFGFLAEMHETMKTSSLQTREVRQYMGPYIDGAMEATFTTLKPGENVTLMENWKKVHETYKKNNPLGKVS